MKCDAKRIRELERTAFQIRLMGLDMVQTAGSGHLGGAFSMAEILTALYFEKMNIRPRQPDWPDRDRLVLSKGHGTVALYPVLAKRGFFPETELASFRQLDSRLSGHAEMHVPGVDMSTGSLGQGLSVAVGMALSGKMQRRTFYTYAICGDGEIEEGQIWEAAAFAAHYGLDRLIMILDHNGLQLDGWTRDVLNMGDLCAKFQAFGWRAYRVDGHDMTALLDVMTRAQTDSDRPAVIVADTVKGKGVSFMENQVQYHGHVPDNETLNAARAELIDRLQKLV